MTRKQLERYNQIRDALPELSSEEIDILLRAEKTLSRWSELECNGTIQREEETGIAYYYNDYTGRKGSRAPDREKGALKRIEAICTAHGLHYYHQTDPRGCALYIGREPLPDNNYTRGIAICID